jgi:hypothetical protein
MMELECGELDGSVAFTVGVAAALTIGFATATVGVAVGFTVGVAAALTIGFAAATVGVAVAFTVGVAFAFCPEFTSMWAVLELGLTTTVPYWYSRCHVPSAFFSALPNAVPNWMP